MCVVPSVGLRFFYLYERYATHLLPRSKENSIGRKTCDSFAWLPQLLMLFILIGSAGPRFHSSLASFVTGRNLAANRLLFLSLCFYILNSWAGEASDYHVYYPSTTPK